MIPPRPRIGIDVRAAHRGRGVGSYVKNLVSALIQLGPPIDLVLYSDRPAAAAWNPSANWTIRTLPARPFPVWEQSTLPRAVDHDRIELIHHPINTGPITTRLVPSVVTVHDLMFMSTRRQLPFSPSPYQTFGRLYRRIVFPSSVKHARRVMVDSQNTLNDLVARFPRVAQLATVIPLAADPSFRRLSPLVVETTLNTLGVAPTNRFILALGAVEPRKNTERCLAAFSQFRDANHADHLMVVTGAKPSDQPRYAEWSRKHRLEGFVNFLPLVSDDQLMALYSAATALLYPSLYEGFGLPVLEAMACGCPVITSKTGSLPEVAGDAAILVDPYDVSDMAAALQQVASQPGFRKGLVERGLRRVTRFSWTRTAERTAQVYEEVVSATAAPLAN